MNSKEENSKNLASLLFSSISSLEKICQMYLYIFVHVTGGFLKVHDHRRLSVVNFMLKNSVLSKKINKGYGKSSYNK